MRASGGTHAVEEEEKLMNGRALVVIALVTSLGSGALDAATPRPAPGVHYYQHDPWGPRPPCSPWGPCPPSPCPVPWLCPDPPGPYPPEQWWYALRAS